MTAQSVLMNKYAVAIASDSVISREHSDSVFLTKASQDKIMNLNGDHDVAFMLSGSVALRGIPFPVLVWEWSKTLTQKFSDLNEYLPSFLTWLQNRSEINNSMQDEVKFTDMLEDLLQKIWNSTSHFNTHTLIDKIELERLNNEFTEEIRNWKKYCFSRQTFNQWDFEVAKKLSTNKYSEIVTDRINFWFDDRPISEVSFNLLIEICNSLPAWYESDDSTDLVIVGFGENDLLPKLSFVSIYGNMDGKLRCEDIEYRSIGSDGSFYRFFGQWHASIQFIRGVDIEMRRIILEFFEKYIRNLMSSNSMFDEDEGDEDLEFQIQNHVRDATNQLETIIANYEKDNFENPLIQVISMSPEADLAKLAKSLIEIQAIRQSINEATPTVGGPIDVAVISKTKGFRWVNHKSLEIP